MESIMSDERTTMLKGAVTACFKAHEPITVANVRAKLPEDFFLDFDSGEPLADAEVFKEIQATYAATPKSPMLVTETPDGRKLGNTMAEEDFSGDADESLRDTWAPETVREPVIEAEPAEQVRPVSHELNPQARLDTARKREQALLGERPILQAAQRNAREALAKAVRAYQEGGPRQTHEDLARDFIRASQTEREARARGELWAIKPERRTSNGAAYVDIERSYGQGGDANTFARKMARTGNRRGAYGKQSLGTVNRDPSRGPVPAPVVTKPTVPALAK
jgi:hypothetical protein